MTPVEGCARQVTSGAFEFQHAIDFRTSMTLQAPKVRRIAEPLYEDNLPDKPCITLDEVIALIAEHGVEIPEEEALQIEHFVEKLPGNAVEPIAQRPFQPAMVMARLYRRWLAASRLHWELTEHAEHSPAWRNWSVTGQPVRLDAEGRKRAMSIVERMISCNRDQFNDFLCGREPLTPLSLAADSVLFGVDDRAWLSGLGFETDAVLEFLRAKAPAADNVSETGRPEVATEDEPVNEPENELEWVPKRDLVTRLEMVQHNKLAKEKMRRTFNKPSPGLEPAKKSMGQGRPALWDPVQAALWLIDTSPAHWSFRIFDDLFQRFFPEWRSRWEKESAGPKRRAGL
ncbi:Uncharacterised protein [Burkholderia pseudomallei]|nr:Uncharacterised protein [Burkholderia pseudomallei]VCN52071.1 Uncharacterised protein [Burkholderia pseudomallei]VCN64653.1 Uncharacterised protein [Burkholderia pseudomallei]VCN71226.1 Uncharacterised protein [Burkholderia pseudomallei]VCN92691.1 Uncharacterised protein [Burkholderia pseudomallei]